MSKDLEKVASGAALFAEIFGDINELCKLDTPEKIMLRVEENVTRLTALRFKDIEEFKDEVCGLLTKAKVAKKLYKSSTSEDMKQIVFRMAEVNYITLRNLFKNIPRDILETTMDAVGEAHTGAIADYLIHYGVIDNGIVYNLTKLFEEGTVDSVRRNMENMKEKHKDFRPHLSGELTSLMQCLCMDLAGYVLMKKYIGKYADHPDIVENMQYVMDITKERILASYFDKEVDSVDELEEAYNQDGFSGAINFFAKFKGVEVPDEIRRMLPN